MAWRDDGMYVLLQVLPWTVSLLLESLLKTLDYYSR
jgi:hypothetical protein